LAQLIIFLFTPLYRLNLNLQNLFHADDIVTIPYIKQKIQLKDIYFYIVRIKV